MLMTLRPIADFSDERGDDGSALHAPSAAGMMDYCTREGADALRRRIEAFWKERGYDVMVTLHNVGFHPAIRAARYELRSDLMNGLPRARKRQGGLFGHANDDRTSEDEAGEL